MDSQDYLNQIAATSKPVMPKTGLAGILSSKYFKWGMIALAVLIVIIIFGAILGSDKKPSVGDKCYALNLRLTSDVEMIDTYQPSVKSSKLRSISASLKGILSNTSSQLTTYITEVLGIKDNDKKMEPLVEEAELNKEALNEDLFAAKINGLLDRTYAHKMAFEIYTIMSDEAGIINATNDEDLKSLLEASSTSLDNLYNEFNDFSETK